MCDNCLRVGNSIVCFSPDYKIRFGRRVWLFEFHNYLGPTIIDEEGEPKEYPPEDHPFWRALYKWIKRGKHVGADGFCVWKTRRFASRTKRHNSKK